MQLAFNAVDKTQRLAKIDLSMAGRMEKWNEHFLCPALLLTNIVRNDGELSGVAVLVTYSFEYPLCRMALLLDNPLIVFQYLIDDRGETVQLRAHRSNRPLISGGNRVHQDLRYRLTIYPK